MVTDITFLSSEGSQGGKARVGMIFHSQMESEDRYTVVDDCCGLLNGCFGGVIMMWVNFGSGQRCASLFYEQLKKSPASPMPSSPPSATDPLLSSLEKTLERQPFFLAYFSSPLKKVPLPSTAPINQCRNHSKRHMCVQLRTLSPCAAAEGYLSIIVPILPTLSLPNTLPIFFFPTGRGCMEIGLHLFRYKIWSS